MIEPRPPQVTPPQDGARQIRVGVVLAEDQLSSCRFTSAHSSLSLSHGDKTYSIPLGQPLTVTLAEKSLILHYGSEQVQLSDAHVLRVAPQVMSALSPQSGIELYPCVVGRTFHWRKSVALTFPGSLEVHSSGNALTVVNELPFEDYCACVITSEMSARCPPAYAFAQAVVARSWSYVFLRNKHHGEKFEVCNDDDCQRYQGSTFLSPESLRAVRKSAGLYLVDAEGHVCPAYYSKSCGGHSELAEVSFGFPVAGISSVHDAMPQDAALSLSDETVARRWILDAPHNCFCGPEAVPQNQLRSYLGAVDESQQYFRWSFQISREDISALIRERSGIHAIGLIDDLYYGTRGKSGRLSSLEVRYTTDVGKGSLMLSSQYAIRRHLHQSFLLSSAFVHSWKKNPSNSARDILELNGAGWGHGVGMCQIGALGMALAGHDGPAILAHYFPKCEVVRAK